MSADAQSADRRSGLSRPRDVVFDELTHARADEIIARYPESRSALLPLLHLVQSVEGFVSQPGIEFCARSWV